MSAGRRRPSAYAANVYEQSGKISVYTHVSSVACLLRQAWSLELHANVSRRSFTDGHARCLPHAREGPMKRGVTAMVVLFIYAAAGAQETPAKPLTFSLRAG